MDQRSAGTITKVGRKNRASYINARWARSDAIKFNETEGSFREKRNSFKMGVRARVVYMFYTASESGILRMMQAVADRTLFWLAGNRI